ncbi:bcr [Symbiodinium sp. CCMP2592]|nr:bcr [Symbiodinium sp. CCMP2592]
MAVAGTLGAAIPKWLPWGPITSIRASMAPLLASAVCLAFTAALDSKNPVWFMTSVVAAEIVLYTPFISAVCQFTCNIEDIAGVASSLLSSLVYLGSSLVSFVIVLASRSDPSALLYFLAGTLVLVGLCLWLGPLDFSLCGLDDQHEQASEVCKDDNDRPREVNFMPDDYGATRCEHNLQKTSSPGVLGP